MTQQIHGVALVIQLLTVYTKCYSLKVLYVHLQDIIYHHILYINLTVS